MQNSLLQAAVPRGCTPGATTLTGKLDASPRASCRWWRGVRRLIGAGAVGCGRPRPLGRRGVNSDSGPRGRGTLVALEWRGTEGLLRRNGRAAAAFSRQGHAGYLVPEPTWRWSLLALGGGGRRRGLGLKGLTAAASTAGGGQDGRRALHGHDLPPRTTRLKFPLGACARPFRPALRRPAARIRQCNPDGIPAKNTRRAATPAPSTMYKIIRRE